MSNDRVLDRFHPLVGAWFRQSVGTPTAVQELAWPLIADGEHVLVTAPTGSGKTFTAFLWALNGLARGDQEPGGVRVLYVSPLKALGTDIRLNLTVPLEEMRARFRAEGQAFPSIGVETRTGDTPQNERRRMLRRPPEILITTPESLNLMLNSRQARAILTGVRTVILDEIHAVVDSKRGVHLMSAVERLALLSGEFQRIALSATVHPLEEVARMIGGARLRDGRYEPRPVRVVEAPRTKTYRINVRFPLAEEPPAEAKTPADEQDRETIWNRIAAKLRDRIRAARSTLVFTNNRALSEKLARLLNDFDPGTVYAHHGSLSRELRRVVEVRLKKGELAAVVATSSLELGIDVGALDQVLLVETPRSIASAIQRVGRAGHGVGQTSAGEIFAVHGRDLVEAAVLGGAIRAGAIEPVRPVRGALDVLAQVILSMVAVEDWRAEDLFAFVRTIDAYGELSRARFDGVLNMLAGRYERARVRELKPRVTVENDTGIVRARDGVLPLLYSSGGTIPDRGYFDLRTESSRTRIGTLDEEFVWERRAGDAFTLGAGAWRITRITHSDVEVVPAGDSANLVPFWRAEDINRSFFFSERIGRFLERAGRELDGPGFARALQDEYGLDGTAAGALIDFLGRQRAATGELPHRHLIVAERYQDPLAPQLQIILHTNRGGRVNRPLALVLAAAYLEEYGVEPEHFANDDCVSLLLPEATTGAALLDLVSPERLDDLLRRKLESTGFFGARFRENAGRALLLPKAGFGRRTPLWQSRLRAKKLLEEVQAFPDFPVVLETWRACLQDEFDLDHLRALFDEIRAGTTELLEVETNAPSPFAAGVIWRQVNRYMYADDTPGRAGDRPSISSEIFRDMVRGTRLRPRIPNAVIAEYRARRQRLSPGYAPTTSFELYDWICERVVLSPAELDELFAAVARDAGMEAFELLRAAGLDAKVFRMETEGEGLVVGLQRLAELLAARRDEAVPLAAVAPDRTEIAALRRLDGVALSAVDRDAITAVATAFEPDGQERQALLVEWLSFVGPVPRPLVHQVFGPGSDETLNELGLAGVIIEDSFRENEEIVEICDAATLEILLRMARRRAAPVVPARPVSDLTWFLANWQGLPRRENDGENGIAALQKTLETLFAFPAPAALWESDLLPARLKAYRPGDLDALFAEGDLAWFGTGREKISIVFQEDLGLFREGAGTVGGDGAEAAAGSLSPFPVAGRFDFFELQQRTGLDRATLVARLWQAAWAGRVSNTGFVALRRGCAAKFQAEEARPGRGRWQSARPVPGLWYSLPEPGEPADALEAEEWNKQRARQLFARYGVLCRELVALELPASRWSRVFRALRIMELSGEIIAGYFFEGVGGTQFMLPAALRLFRELDAKVGRPFWISALDPASLSGLGLEGLTGLPRRAPGQHLAYGGRELLLVSESRGRRLSFRVEPEDERLAGALGMFRDLLETGSLKKVFVETVNDEPAALSPYADMMRAFGFRKEMTKLILHRHY